MDKKEQLAIAERVQKRIQRQLSDFHFISKRDEINKEFSEPKVIREDRY
jgi:hypothetical protein